MIGDAGVPGSRVAKEWKLQLTPTTGLVLGLVLSATFWAVAAEVAHLAGLI